MTIDDRYILGPVPGVRGFWLLTGCCVGGLSISPGLGEALAQWIVDGTPPIDLSEIGIERFAEPRAVRGRAARALPRGVRQPLRGERRRRLDRPERPALGDLPPQRPARRGDRDRGDGSPDDSCHRAVRGFAEQLQVAVRPRLDARAFRMSNGKSDLKGLGICHQLKSEFV